MAVPGSTDRSLDAAGQRQNTGRKERTVLAGYRLLAEMVKMRYGYDFWKETDPVVRTETGKPYLRLHPELSFNISHSGDWIACALGDAPVGLDIQYHREIKVEQTARKSATRRNGNFFNRQIRSGGKRMFCFRSGQKKKAI